MPVEPGLIGMYVITVRTSRCLVYCKDGRRTGTHERIGFDFLGCTFRPREIVRRDGSMGTGFTPALSRLSMTAMRQTMRRHKLHHRSDWTLADLARAMEPHVRGWMAYYCRFRGSEFQSGANHLDRIIVRWAMRKVRRLRGHRRRVVIGPPRRTSRASTDR